MKKFWSNGYQFYKDKDDMYVMVANGNKYRKYEDCITNIRQHARWLRD